MNGGEQLGSGLNREFELFPGTMSENWMQTKDLDASFKIVNDEPDTTFLKPLEIVLFAVRLVVLQ